METYQRLLVLNTLIRNPLEWFCCCHPCFLLKMYPSGWDFSFFLSYISPRRGTWCFITEEVLDVNRGVSNRINTYIFIGKGGRRWGCSMLKRPVDYTVMSLTIIYRMQVPVAESKGASFPHVVPAGELGLHHEGLSRICKDGIDSISGGIRELEEHGYLIRERVRGANGQLGSIEYTILEQPKEPTPAQEKPIRENPVQANPTLVTPVQEEPAQLNKDKSSNDPSRTDLSSTEVSNPIQSNPPYPRRGEDGNGWDGSQRKLSRIDF